MLTLCFFYLLRIQFPIQLKYHWITKTEFQISGNLYQQPAEPQQIFLPHMFILQTCRLWLIKLHSELEIYHWIWKPLKNYNHHLVWLHNYIATEVFHDMGLKLVLQVVLGWKLFKKSNCFLFEPTNFHGSWITWPFSVFMNTFTLNVCDVITKFTILGLMHLLFNPETICVKKLWLGQPCLDISANNILICFKISHGPSNKYHTFFKKIIGQQQEKIYLHDIINKIVLTIPTLFPVPW